MRRKIIIKYFLLFVGIIYMINLTACNTQPAESNLISQQKEDTTEEVEKHRTFAIVYPVAHPFFEAVTTNAEETAKKMGINLIVRSPENSRVEQQIQIMKDLIKMEVDGIGIGPTDPEALTPLINEASDAGIKIITFDTDAPQSKRLAYIGTDNLSAGHHLGEVVAQLLNYEGTIIGSTGISTMLNLNTRIEGVKQVLDKYPNIKLMEIRSSDGNPAKTLKNIEDLVLKHPDFDALIGIESLSGPAAITVWKAKGLHQPVVTFDDLPIILEGITNGQITSTISQRQFTWGSLILKRLNDTVDGKDIPVFENTGTVEITAENVNNYIQKTTQE